MARRRVMIMGSAGRGFHNFNMLYRDDPRHEVVAFIMAHIPDIVGKRYPPELSGPLYPDGIALYPDTELVETIHRFNIDEVMFAGSDMPYQQVLRTATTVITAGANFALPGARSTQLVAAVPVIAVVAVRTGCGKSPTARKICRLLREQGLRAIAIHHPQPHGDIASAPVRRCSSHADLQRYNCTINELEELEPHIMDGTVIYSGTDYAAIVREAEREADVLVWDGGNNDLSFIQADLTITVTDPHRLGQELVYYPGEANLRAANVVVVNKVDSAPAEHVSLIHQNIRQVNPRATIIDAASPLHVDSPASIYGQRVLVVEDGPTLTRGGMSYGAGMLAAGKYGAFEIIDPHPYAVGSIAETFRAYPELGALLPAIGYASSQMRDLEATIRRVPCDNVVLGTPIDLSRAISIDKPTTHVTYDLAELSSPDLRAILQQFTLKHNLAQVHMAL